MVQKRNYHIRAASEDDARLLATWWGDGSVMEHAGFPNGLQTDVDALRVRLKNQTPSNTLWIIEQPPKNPVGEMNHRIKDRIAEIGIKLCGPSSQGQGLGPEALKWLINYLFSHYDITAIVLDTMIENTRAQAVYERLYFEQTAVLEDCWRDQLGRLRTAIAYQLTRERFEQYYQRIKT